MWSVRKAFDTAAGVCRGNEPDSSAFLNFVARGCRSRLGRDLTNLKVCRTVSRLCFRSHA